MVGVLDEINMILRATHKLQNIQISCHMSKLFAYYIGVSIFFNGNENFFCEHLLKMKKKINELNCDKVIW